MKLLKGNVRKILAITMAAAIMLSITALFATADYYDSNPNATASYEPTAYVDSGNSDSTDGTYFASSDELDNYELSGDENLLDDKENYDYDYDYNYEYEKAEYSEEVSETGFMGIAPMSIVMIDNLTQLRNVIENPPIGTTGIELTSTILVWENTILGPSPLPITANGGGFTVPAGVNFTLTGISLYGGAGTGVTVSGNNATFSMINSTISGFDNRGVVVSAGGTFNMNSGTIQDNLNTNHGGWGGAGVRVFGTGSTFTMNDGTITGNISAQQGGGILVNAGATFTMNGGLIEDNTSNHGGGVRISGAFSSFTMTGGTINSNNTIGNGNGGGVLVDDFATFNMSGGSITGHTIGGQGGGVNVNTHGVFAMTGGTISGNTAIRGGGVWVNGTFNMLNNPAPNSPAPQVIHNTANADGGGVFLLGGNFTMNSGTTIYNNTAHAGGGGVFLARSNWLDNPNAPGLATFEMFGGTISTNTAQTGGGVLIHGVYANLTMHNGLITNNTAGGFGGGISLGLGLHGGMRTTSATILGGTISNNNATNGGGVANQSSLSMKNVDIINNTATNDGGGVWTWANDLPYLKIAESVQFNLNASHRTFNYVGDDMPNIRWLGANSNGGIINDAAGVVGGSRIHLLNNDDVNYRNILRVFYDGNADGVINVPVDDAIYAPVVDNVTVLPDGTMDSPERPGYDFVGWNTMPDGTGTTWLPNDAFEMPPHNVTLYAQWTPIIIPNVYHTVTFVLNGGVYSGSQNSVVRTVLRGTDAQELSTNPTRVGYTFDGWAPVLNLTNVTENRTFVAQWTPVGDGGNGGGNGEPGGGGPGGGTPPPPQPPVNTPNPPTPPIDEIIEPPMVDLIVDPPVVNPPVVDPPSDTPAEIPVADEVAVTIESQSGSASSPTWIYDPTIPRATLGGRDVFLFAPLGETSWSLVSLILTILGVVLGVVTVIRFVLKKKEEHDSEHELHHNNEMKEKAARNKTLCFIATIATAIIGIIVFLIFNDIRTPIVLVNIWTILNAIVFTLEAVAIKLMRKKPSDDKEEQMQAAPA